MKSNNFLVNNFLQHSEKLLINNPTKGLIPLQLWEHQVDVVEKLFEDRRIVVSSARQMGMTTLMLTIAHWYAKNYPNKTIVYTSHSQTMLNVAREFFRQLDYNVQFKTMNSQRLELMNGSKILFDRMSVCNFRGYVIDMFLVDNAAFIKMNDYDVQRISTQLTVDAFMWINSTPCGCDNWFAKIYGGTNNYKKIHLPWFKRKDRNEAWIQDMKLKLTPDQFKQEMMAEFL